MRLLASARSIFAFQIKIAALVAGVVLASGWSSPATAGNGPASSEVVFATGFQTPDASFCDALSFSESSAAPAKRVTLLNLPQGFRVPEIYASRDGKLLGRLVTAKNDEGATTFVAPLLEDYDASYSLNLTLTGINNGELVTCAELPFTVDPLPEAPGEPIQETVQSLDQSIQELKALLGAANVDLTQDPATLSRPLRLLAMADYLLQGAKNENALVHVLDGTAPLLSELGIAYDADLLERLFASSGAVAALQEFANALAEENARIRAGAKGALSLICPEDMTDPDELVSCMTSQSQLSALVEDRAKVAVTTLTASLSLLALAYPPAAGVATATGLILFVLQTLVELTVSALPSEVGPIEFDITKDEFFEDEQGTSGTWENVQVSARSGGEITLSWFFFAEAGLQIVGPFAAELGTLTRAFFEAANEMLFEAFLLVAGVANAILDITVPTEAGAAITWPPIDYGPVQMDDPRYYNVAPTSIFGSFSVQDEQRRYTKINLLERGPVSWDLTLESDLAGDYFPYGNQAVGSRTISMPEINILIDAPSTASPGETVQVFATVDRAVSQTLNFSLVPALGELQMGEPTDGFYSGTYEAPDTGTFPVTVAITATHPDITERTRSTDIRIGPEIEISPDFACVEPGEFEQFTATVTGLNNTAVNWDASAGSISNSGLFSAPNSTNTMDVAIKATSVEDPDTSAEIVIRTGAECQCYFQAFVSGAPTSFFDGPAQYEISSAGEVTVTLRSRQRLNGGPFEGAQGAFQTAPIAMLQPGTFNLNSANVNFFEFPPFNAIYISGEEGADCPSCGGQTSFDSYVTDQRLTGSASVTMLGPRDENDERPTVSMVVDFRAAFGSQFDSTSPYVQCSALYGD